MDLRDRLGVALLFISHNLAVVRQVSDDVLVIYRGRTVEHGPVDRVLSEPAHPYTRMLLSSIPRPGSARRLSTATAEDPDSGCRFRNRCPFAFQRCATEPTLLAVGDGHVARCWLAMGGGRTEPTALAEAAIG